MTDCRALSFEECYTLLEQPLPTLILLHRAPDADTIGSAFALRQLINALGAEAYCICADEVPDRLRFLISEWQNSILPESVPEQFVPERVISVDIASPAQLGSLRETYEDHTDLMIDHHANGTPFADHYIIPDAAATGEILYDFIKVFAQQEQIAITESLCAVLYAAISSDTGGFRYANVTPETHMRAAELVASGIDCAEINHRLFESRSMEQLRATAAGISNLHLHADGKVAVILFPYALKAALGLQDAHLESLVEVARALDGVRIAMVIRQPSTESVFRVSVRASCAYDVASLCATFGGGGHPCAAGCTLNAKDIEDAMEKIVNSIDFSQIN